jgi:hypothetical protein
MQVHADAQTDNPTQINEPQTSRKSLTNFMRLIDGFPWVLRLPPPITLTATIYLYYYIKLHQLNLHMNHERIGLSEAYAIKLFHLIEVSTSFEGTFVHFRLCLLVLSL